MRPDVARTQGGYSRTPRPHLAAHAQRRGRGPISRAGSAIASDAVLSKRGAMCEFGRLDPRGRAGVKNSFNESLLTCPAMNLAFGPPLAPMLAKAADELPRGDGWLYEPKWDGFRTIVFRDGAEIYLQSRDEKPMNRYFPELVAGLPPHLPERCILDGETVIAGPNGLDFEALLLRIHPAASRVAMLAKQSPCSFVAFDVLGLGDEDLRATPQE